MAVLNVSITEESGAKLEEISKKVFENRKGATIEALLEAGCFSYNGELIEYSEIVGMPILNLNRLKYRGGTGSIRTTFRKNFGTLPFRYKKSLFTLLYILCHAKDPQKRLMFNEVFLGVNENISLNYTNAELERIDPKHCANMGVYINIKGRIGSVPIREYVGQNRRDALTDPKSLIWISKFERLVTDRFYEHGKQTIYTEILKALNIEDRTAVQLDYKDIEDLIVYFKKELITKHLKI
ncbi:hypothetical protein [Clostridium sp.]|uniref:hypothetical protein n=1 Tax=Clostridium sp. TaxID=1506 RepID=UPI003D6C879C